MPRSMPTFEDDGLPLAMAELDEARGLQEISHLRRR